MTKLKKYLIRESNSYVEPKRLKRKLSVVLLVFAVVLVIFNYSLIGVLSAISILWILVAMWVLDLKESLMIAIQKQQEYLEKNNLIYVLLSNHNFVYDYIHDLVVVSILIFAIGKINVILWFIAIFLLNIVDAVISVFISNFFEKKLLH